MKLYQNSIAIIIFTSCISIAGSAPTAVPSIKSAGVNIYYVPQDISQKNPYSLQKSQELPLASQYSSYGAFLTVVPNINSSSTLAQYIANNNVGPCFPVAIPASLLNNFLTLQWQNLAMTIIGTAVSRNIGYITINNGINTSAAQNPFSQGLYFTMGPIISSNFPIMAVNSQGYAVNDATNRPSQYYNNIGTSVYNQASANFWNETGRINVYYPDDEGNNITGINWITYMLTDSNKNPIYLLGAPLISAQNNQNPLNPYFLFQSSMLNFNTTAVNQIFPKSSITILNPTAGSPIPDLAAITDENIIGIPLNGATLNDPLSILIINSITNLPEIFTITGLQALLSSNINLFSSGFYLSFNEPISLLNANNITNCTLYDATGAIIASPGVKVIYTGLGDQSNNNLNMIPAIQNGKSPFNVSKTIPGLIQSGTPLGVMIFNQNINSGVPITIVDSSNNPINTTPLPSTYFFQYSTSGTVNPNANSGSSGGGPSGGTYTTLITDETVAATDIQAYTTQYTNINNAINLGLNTLSASSVTNLITSGNTALFSTSNVVYDLVQIIKSVDQTAYNNLPTSIQQLERITP